jgi:hypothetical protein
LDRQIVYPGAIPLETDLLNTNKNAMFALGQFAQDVLGTSTVFTGLACVPNTPAAMNVIVQPGAVYAQAVLDATAYSSLAADSTVTQKQGILKTAQTFATPAPTTSGQSVVYLISASFLEADTNAVVLPYYNAANPSQAYSGPNGTGASQNTTRQDTVQLTLTAGVPATTGSQITPATPAGQIALYTITVAFGASTVTAANIAKVSGAPFLSAPLLAQIQAPVPGRLLRTSIYRINGGTQQVQTIVNGVVTAFTSTGASTFTPLSATNFVDVECNGGGGAGGGAGGAGASTVSVGAPGVAGTYARGMFGIASVGSSQAVTVGAGGVAASNTAGTNGGSTSLGTLIVAPGGAGGGLFNNVTPPTANGNSIQSGAPTGANVLSMQFVAQTPGMAFSTTAGIGALGGSGFFGTGGAGGGFNAVGVAATNPGTGGAGVTVNQAGGNGPGTAGAAGIVIVREYS